MLDDRHEFRLHVIHIDTRTQRPAPFLDRADIGGLFNQLVAFAGFLGFIGDDATAGLGGIDDHVANLAVGVAFADIFGA